MPREALHWHLDLRGALMSFQVFGIAVSRGVAIGRAVLVASSRVDVAHYFLAPEQIQADIQRLLRERKDYEL